MSAPLLVISDLCVDVRPRRAPLRVLEHVSLDVAPGEVLGIVGESGSGKSMSMRAAARQLPEDATMTGQVSYDGTDIYRLSSRALRDWRRREIAFIPQDPRASINPTRTVGDFLTEALREDGESRAKAAAAAIDVLRQVDIPDGAHRMAQYPHQLSGGLLQRIAIAAALLARPRLLVADEPTTALDVTTQEEVVAILREAQRHRALAMIFITHDLDLAAAITDRLAVMYAGRVVEQGPTSGICAAPNHPYTTALLASRPSVQAGKTAITIPGRPKPAYEVATGCPFADRCAHARETCQTVAPELTTHGTRSVACHYAEKLRGSHA
jgi:oligopeptide/dipeptide ABC transporter ATP-binding protein